MRTSSMRGWSIQRCTSNALLLFMSPCLFYPCAKSHVCDSRFISKLRSLIDRPSKRKKEQSERKRKQMRGIEETRDFEISIFRFETARFESCFSKIARRARSFEIIPIPRRLSERLIDNNCRDIDTSDGYVNDNTVRTRILYSA